MQQRLTTKSILVLVALAALGTTFAAGAQSLDPASLNGGLAERAAQDYRARARFPESSRALTSGEVDPILAKRESAPHSLPPRATGGDLTLTVWADAVSFESPAPVVLHLSAGGGDTAGMTVVGEVVGQQGDSVGKVVYRDNGRGADAVAGDGVYTARFVMPKDRVPKLAESFLVKIEATTPNGVSRAAGGFLYSRPWARLTGRYQDRLENGNLVVGVEIEVAEAGRFHVAGTLYSDAGEPFGWAQAAAELTPGTHWLDLSYYGLIFHERAVAGPYHLGTLSLATTSGMPNALNRLAEGVYTTAAYDLSAFTSEPFAEPSLLDAARRLEADAVFSRLKAGSK
jgi:hypothetical protein